MVSTPIGNLGDLSHRAVTVLRDAALVLAEDTRHSRTLLAHHDIGTPTQPYHEHNEARATPGIIERLHQGHDVALVSDAGTPLVSDPGARLVAAAVEAGIPVVPVPGASALLAALVGAALPAERFTFYGFPPRRGRERRELIAEIAGLRHTSVIYEAPGRLAATLGELADVAGANRPAVVARELTKHFEEFRRGTLGELSAYYRSTPPRGEIVVVIGGRRGDDTPDADTLATRAAELRSRGMLPRDVARVLVEEAGIGRNQAYRLAHGSGERGTGSRGGPAAGSEGESATSPTSGASDARAEMEDGA